METIGDRIRWTVEEHAGVSQAEFARRIGKARQLLSRWINDPESRPNEESLQLIAETAGVSPAWLRYGTGPRTLNGDRESQRRKSRGDLALVVDGPEQELPDQGAFNDGAREGDLTSLLASRKALYQTLTDFGGPGEATDDKLSLLELLSKVAARLKREGRDVSARHVLAAQNDVINGDL